jgi:cholesterol transport system auxiliary component
MKRRIRPLLRVSAAVGLALALSGCISLLPKTKPSQLYRFGASAASSAAPAATAARGAPVGVLRAGGMFQREAAGDRILTLTGERAAYIAQARWVAPAEVLFDQALSAAFDGAQGRARLVARGEPVRIDYALRLDVRNFETHYDGGRAPVVLVRVRAVMSSAANREQPVEQVFEARAPAGDNRVGAIVQAYDKAIADVLAQLIAWTNDKAA